VSDPKAEPYTARHHVVWIVVGLFLLLGLAADDHSLDLRSGARYEIDDTEITLKAKSDEAVITFRKEF
jgi:hypothetical protein